MIKSLVGFCSALSAFAMIKPRDMAPDFKNINAVVGQEFTKINFSDYSGKYVVLVFYPFDFTYVCPTELIAFSEAVSQFDEVNAKILGVSTDSHHTHLAWVKTPRTEGGLGKIEYPLLADFSKEISRNYGVLVDDPKDGMYGAALRGIYIIDGTGKIRSMQINDDSVGRSVDEVLRLIRGFQFADVNGEVCPANWQPGGKTIKPNQVDKKEFFKEAYKSTDL
jgi:alkyl hydroperoxide reductase subunit AhpC